MARILIADDDPTVREMLTLILQSRGHETHEAADGAEALAAHDAWGPDLLVVDLAMPEGGGLQVARELRSRTPPVRCPIIILTGYADAVQAQELQELDATAVLQKPLTLQALFSALDEALKRVTSPA